MLSRIATFRVFRSRSLAPPVALAALVCLAACNPNRHYFGAGVSTGPVSLRGAGSSFVAPLMQKWTAEFNRQTTAGRVDYQSTGSGAGIQGAQERTLDFGATDAPLTDQSLAKTPDMLHIPVVSGAVVVSYNLPQVKEPLRFSPEVLAGIFLGEITRWDDGRIKADNPEAALPDDEIGVVHRSDGSGTTDIFTDYLSKVSPEWKQRVGRGTSVKWLTGTGGKGNEGVTGALRQTPATIGYVEAIYAKQNKLPIALIRNRAGNFVPPGDDNIREAAETRSRDAPEDLRLSITDAEGASAYPISGFTYVLAFREQTDARQGKLLADFLYWSLHNGSTYARQLQYVPLPEPLVRRAEAKIASMTSGGVPLR